MSIGLISLKTSDTDVMTYQEFHVCLLSTEDVYASMSTMPEDVPSFPFYMETLPVVLPHMYNKWAWHHCCCRQMKPYYEWRFIQIRNSSSPCLAFYNDQTPFFFNIH